jgi:hypothetical protein
MEALDLTVRPPRGPRVPLAGCVFMARMVDKLRAELPGGAIGEYLVDGPGTLGGYQFHKLRLNVDEVRAIVAAASDEDEVAAWLRERINPAVVEELNAKLAALRIDGGTPEDYTQTVEHHPWLRDRPEITNAFDMLETDDDLHFPGVSVAR